MNRALAILKFVPAVLCGLLVVAWVRSLCRTDGIQLPLGKEGGGGIELLIQDGGFTCMYGWHVCFNVIIGNSHQTDSRMIFAWLRYFPDGSVQYCGFRISTLLLASLFIPLSIGPFTRFRFPLWSYFAWTALIAAELAYYLR